MVCPEGDGGGHADGDLGEAALGDGDLDFTFSILCESHDGLPCGDDLSLLGGDARDHAVRACNEVRIAERVAALCVLCECLTVGGLGGAFVCTVLIEHRLRDCLCGIELLIARTVGAGEIKLCARGGDACTCRIRLLLYVACVDDHEHVACMDVRTQAHIAREDLPADLKGELRLIACADDPAVVCL